MKSSDSESRRDKFHTPSSPPGSVPKWLDWARRIQAIGQIGEAYTKDVYDLERFQQLRELAAEIMDEYTDEAPERIRELFTGEVGYQTPKVDVRGVVFQGETILLVQEAMDGGWTLPGGWADVQVSPAENAAREVFEESGYIVQPVRLLAVWDRARHAHPPGPWHTYKIMFECEITGGAPKTSHETLDVGFFSLNDLPPLSTMRTTQDQLQRLLELHKHPERSPEFD
jgi:ADP-ribose pyrophosphatase YjhB (NUDIX family)